MADDITQPQLTKPDGGAFDWGAADSARRESIAQGHERIRDSVRRNLPARRGPDWEQGSQHSRALAQTGPNWNYYQGQQGQGQTSPGADKGGVGEPEPEPQLDSTSSRFGKLGAMFKDPEVRDHVERISNSWETANLIRKGGIHSAIRHAFGLKQFSSHPNDEIRAANRRLNPNVGMDPGHYQAQDEDSI
jgi:hypothetical protein